jgi:diguanylate cyclase (GGDEF)-like protein
MHNKKYFLDVIDKEISGAAQTGKATSLMMFDIDNFKSYNDTFGHPAGDKLLKTIGSIVQSSAAQEICCRYGGEEFVIIMPDTGAVDAHQKAETVRKAIEAQDFDHRKVTISAGVVVAMKSKLSAQAMTQEADKALYHSKKTGKNKTTTMIVIEKMRPVPYDAAM